jgi:apolipoprotein N-acyltransferase
MTQKILISYLLSFILGALCVLGFAPFNLFFAPIVGLTGLFYLWHQSQKASQASLLGWFFGLGLFLFGIYWIYISLHDVGGMPAWMAMPATFILCAFLATFPAIVGFFAKKGGRLLWSAPVLWVLFEWVREWIFTGFPWLVMGYSQIPTSPLAGFAPVFGVLGVSLATALSASLLAAIYLNHRRKMAVVMLCSLWLFAEFSSLLSWTKVASLPLQVSLLQGNIAQEMKWNESVSIQTIRQYLEMANKAKGELVILPETALPVSFDVQTVSAKDDNILAAFKELATRNHQSMILGAISKHNNDYFNSAIGLSPSDDHLRFYHKQHLVPFGEFIPLKPVFAYFYTHWLNMPLSDLTRGSHTQSPMILAGQSIAVNICYEDVFGNEIIRQLPDASILVNLSNDAWYGTSNAAQQHLQFSQMRALESGRFMLRATNNGVTAIIDPQGTIVAALPSFETGILNGTVQGYEGSTPYVFWGNVPILLILLIAIILI